jgi:hypothetical protein
MAWAAAIHNVVGDNGKSRIYPRSNIYMTSSILILARTRAQALDPGGQFRSTCNVFAEVGKKATFGGRHPETLISGKIVCVCGV